MSLVTHTHKRYPDWTTVRYGWYSNELKTAYEFVVSGVCVGYAVVIDDYDYEDHDETVQPVKKFLASFEVKIRGKGYGSWFVRELVRECGSMILQFSGGERIIDAEKQTRGNVGLFWHKCGAYLVDDTEIYEGGIMCLWIGSVDSLPSNMKRFEYPTK